MGDLKTPVAAATAPQNRKINWAGWIASSCALIALAGSALLIWARAATKSSIEHDEGISFINASAKMGDWLLTRSAAPAGTWVPASTWQWYLQPTDPWAFSSISQGLAQWDIHPPVYFWLLHVWALAFGMSAASSIALNVVVAVLTGLALFGLARWVHTDAARAAGTVVFWALSASVVAVSLMARQYGLLALLSVCTVWFALAQFTRPGVPRPWAPVVLAGLIALGLATYYQFAFLVAGLLAWMTLTFWSDWKRLGLLYVPSLVGGLLLFALHPGFLNSFSVLSRNTSAAKGDLLRRLKQTVDTIAGFFITPRGASVLVSGFSGVTALAVILGVGILVLVIALIVGMRLHWTDIRPSAADTSSRYRLSAVLFLGMWVLLGIVAMYLTGRSPIHAMGDRYLTMVWPFLAFAPAAALHRLKAAPSAALIVVWALLSVPGQLAAVAAGPTSPRVSDILAPAKHIVVDSIARGVLPRIVIDAAPGTRVFAGPQSSLLRDPGAWADALEPGDIVVSDPRYAEDPANKTRIRQELRQRFLIEQLEGPWPFTWWRVVAAR